MSIRRGAFSLLVVSVLLFAGCGDDSGGGLSDVDGGASGRGGDCSTSLAVERSAADAAIGDGEQRAVSLEPGAVTETAIVGSLAGSSFTVYASDAPFDGEVGTDTIVSDGESTVVTIFLQTGDGASEGLTIEAQDNSIDTGFIAIVDTGGGASGSTGSEPPVGEVTIQRLDDEGMCFAVDYEDNQITLDGTVAGQFVDAFG